jgi:hypothetical protein
MGTYLGKSIPQTEEEPPSHRFGLDCVLLQKFVVKLEHSRLDLIFILWITGEKLEWIGSPFFCDSVESRSASRKEADNGVSSLENWEFKEN